MDREEIKNQIKIPQTEEDLKNLLQEQLHFMQVSADAFDNGDEAEAKRLAVNLRILLHDTEKSKSLLGQFGLKSNLQFFDSLAKPDDLGPFTGLVLKSLGPTGGKYIAPLDDFPPDYTFSKKGFEEYWNEVVFIDNKNNKFSRRDLILIVANQDGGAHVDPEINKEYAELTKNNSLGWVHGFGEEPGKPLIGEALAAIRQISHEVLKTLIPNYPIKKLLNTQESVILGGIHLAKGFQPGVMVNTRPQRSSININPKIGRNDQCSCGSGLKWKRCGLLNTQQHQDLINKNK